MKKFFSAAWNLVKKVPVIGWVLIGGALLLKLLGVGLGSFFMRAIGRDRQQQPAVSGRSRDELNAAAEKVDEEVEAAEDRIDAEVRKEDDAIDDLFGGDP